MDSKKKASIKRYLSFGGIALLTALLAALPALTAKNAEESVKASNLMATVQPRSIDHILPGGGPLEAAEAAKITVPDGVKVKELLVANGEDVTAGTPIAAVDKVSVMTAIKSVQDTLDTVTKNLAAAAGKINPGVITVDEEGKLYSAGKAIPDDKLSSYADFLRLAQQHRDYEELLLDLFRIYQQGTINATADGMIDSLDQSVVSKLSFDGSIQLNLLAVNTPSGEDDELNYIGYAGVLLSVKDGQWKLMMNSVGGEITDFTDLSAVSTEITGMTTPGTHDEVTVFSWNGEEWETVEELKQGDFLIFAYSPEGTEFVLKAGAKQEEQPDRPDNPDKPSYPSYPDFDINAILGAMGSRGGSTSSGSRQEEQLHSTKTTPLCTIVPLETMSFQIAVDETDIALVHPGMTAEVTMDALPNRSFTAVITQISKFGSSNGGSSKFSVTLELPYETGMLPGMNANAVITLGTTENVATIPVAALVDRGAETLVYTGYDVKNDVLLNPMPVTTGISDGEYVQILSGLTENQPVWYSYYDVVEISNAVENRSMFG